MRHIIVLSRQRGGIWGIHSRCENANSAFHSKRIDEHAAENMARGVAARWNYSGWDSNAEFKIEWMSAAALANWGKHK